MSKERYKTYDPKESMADIIGSIVQISNKTCKDDRIMIF